MLLFEGPVLLHKIHFVDIFSRVDFIGFLITSLKFLGIRTHKLDDEHKPFTYEMKQ